MASNAIKGLPPNFTVFDAPSSVPRILHPNYAYCEERTVQTKTYIGYLLNFSTGKKTEIIQYSLDTYQCVSVQILRELCEYKRSRYMMQSPNVFDCDCDRHNSIQRILGLLICRDDTLCILELGFRNVLKRYDIADGGFALVDSVSLDSCPKHEYMTFCFSGKYYGMLYNQTDSYVIDFDDFKNCLHIPSYPIKHDEFKYVKCTNYIVLEAYKNCNMAYKPTDRSFLYHFLSGKLYELEEISVRIYGSNKTGYVLHNGRQSTKLPMYDEPANLDLKFDLFKDESGITLRAFGEKNTYELLVANLDGFDPFVDSLEVLYSILGDALSENNDRSKLEVGPRSDEKKIDVKVVVDANYRQYVFSLTLPRTVCLFNAEEEIEKLRREIRQNTNF